MPTILLVRHGQASFGGSDYDVLSPLGRRQAEAVGAVLRRQVPAVAKVFAGTLRRQLETAAAFDPGEVVEDRRWNEYDGDELVAVHGHSSARLAGSGPTITSREFQEVIDVAIDGWLDSGEDSSCSRSWPRFHDDALGALAAAAAGLGRGETAVAFTSAGVIATICASLLESDETAFAALNRVQVNAAITKIAIGSRGATLVSLNDHSHLEAVDRSLVTYR